MRVEPIDFPTDMYGELGQLREHLVKALHQADNSNTGAVVLYETLKFAMGKLAECGGTAGSEEEKVTAADKAKNVEKQVAKDKISGEKITKALVKAARLKLKKEGRLVNPVRKSKRKTTK